MKREFFIPRVSLALLFGVSLGACLSPGLNNTNPCRLSSTWSTVDDYESFSGNNDNGPWAGFADASGNVFFGGYGTDLGSKSTWIVRRSGNSGATWTSAIDNFQFTSNFSAYASGFVQDRNGNLLSLGQGADSSGQYYCMVRKSTDNGLTWSTLSYFRYPSSANSCWLRNGARDLDGNLYATSEATDSGSVIHWVVWKSSDDGASWSKVDDYNLVGTKKSAPRGIVADSTGNVYVFGFALDGSNNHYWIVRGASRGGTSWSLLSSYQYPGGNSWSEAYGGFLTSAGHLVVAGYGYDSAWKGHGIVRVSTDHGVTWKTMLDSVSDASGADILFYAAAVDNDGNFFVTGELADWSSNYHWITQKSVDWGTTWVTVDDYVLASGQRALGIAMVKDALGAMYVSGSAMDASTPNNHWITRKLGCL